MQFKLNINTTQGVTNIYRTLKVFLTLKIINYKKLVEY